MVDDPSTLRSTNFNGSTLILTPEYCFDNEGGAEHQPRRSASIYALERVVTTSPGVSLSISTLTPLK